MSKVECTFIIVRCFFTTFLIFVIAVEFIVFCLSVVAVITMKIIHYMRIQYGGRQYVKLLTRQGILMMAETGILSPCSLLWL